MANQVGFKRRPKKPSLEEFISEPVEKILVAKPENEQHEDELTLLPWEEAREDVTKVFNLRIPEPVFLKLKHIAENSKYSMQSFCLERLIPEIDEKVENYL